MGNSTEISSTAQEVHYGWQKAVKSPVEVIPGLIACLEAGKNAWIEVMDNNDARIRFPIQVKNPLLDNPFNWTFNYGTNRNEKVLSTYDYFNETEKDLIHNWIAAFGQEKAIRAYQENRTISADMFNGSISHPVRLVDANEYRRNILKDGYEYGFFTHFWKPKEGIDYYVRDPEAGRVFVVCYNHAPVDHREACLKAAEFLKAYAEKGE